MSAAEIRSTLSALLVLSKKFCMFSPGLAGTHAQPVLTESPFIGAVAQLGERLICIQEAIGSIPISSTSVWIDSRLAAFKTRACSSGG
jgi:hypothetical protein